MVRETGLEPVRHKHTPLKRACLPIPALALNNMYYSISRAVCQLLFLKTQKHVRFLHFTAKGWRKGSKHAILHVTGTREENTMTYTKRYMSPLGMILLAADDAGLTGLWFEGSKYFAAELPKAHIEQDTPVLLETIQWLDVYFSGKEPDFTPPLHLIGSDFRQAVWNILLSIPYGRTMTYGQIAKQLAKNTGIDKMSAQAVGGAVGHNPISIIVPCHRVVGTNGSLTGYAGGLDKKIALLKIEKADTERFFRPKKGTAL